MDDMLYICNKTCSIIINSRSYVNVASIILIRNLNLNTIKYYRPYRKYHYKILCDVVSMQASPLLLKRSWQFDSKVVCDGFKNKYSSCKRWKNHHSCIIITKLVSLSPKQVYKTQLKGKGKVRLRGVKIIERL
jgi:hypothetical protein